MKRVLPLLLLAAVLGGCDLLGIESTEAVAGRREADGKAVGAACRQAGRALEDCYTLNKRAERAAIFAGWREMNDYMRENKIEDVAPQLAAQAPGAEPKAKAEAKTDAAAEDGGHKAGAKKPAKS